MVADIRMMRSLMKTRPVLTRSGDMQIALCGTHAVQFDCDEAAHFFVAAYDAVPALLDMLETALAKNVALGQGTLDAAEAKSAALQVVCDIQTGMIAELRRQLDVEVEATGELTKRAKRLLRIAASAQNHKRHADALQVTLDDERRSR